MLVLIFVEITYDDFKSNINDNCTGSQNDSLELPNDTLESIAKEKKNQVNIFKNIFKF